MDANTLAITANTETIVLIASLFLGAFTSMAFVIAVGEVKL